MSVHSRPSIQYQDGMELRDRKMKKDCTQPLRIGNIRASLKTLLTCVSITIGMFCMHVYDFLNLIYLTINH